VDGGECSTGDRGFFGLEAFEACLRALVVEGDDREMSQTILHCHWCRRRFAVEGNYMRSLIPNPRRAQSGLVAQCGLCEEARRRGFRSWGDVEVRMRTALVDRVKGDAA